MVSCEPDLEQLARGVVEHVHVPTTLAFGLRRARGRGVQARRISHCSRALALQSQLSEALTAETPLGWILGVAVQDGDATARPPVQSVGSGAWAETRCDLEGVEQAAQHVLHHLLNSGGTLAEVRCLAVPADAVKGYVLTIRRALLLC